MLNYLKHVVYLCIYLFIYFCRIFCNCNTRNEVWIISTDAFINKPQRNHRWSIAFVNRRGSFSSIANLWNIYPENGFRIRHLRYLLIIECILSKNSTRKKKTLCITILSENESFLEANDAKSTNLRSQRHLIKSFENEQI